MGRPTKYKREYAAQAAKLCQLGATDREVAEFFGVGERAIYRWQSQYPEFRQSLKVGKEAADERVERSLFRRATGYSFDAVKIMQYEGAPVIVPYVEHVAPDTTAAIFWLKNRKPEEWRDVKAVEHDIGQRLAKLADADLESRVAQLLRKGGVAVPAEGKGTTH